MSRGEGRKAHADSSSSSSSTPSEEESDHRRHRYRRCRRRYTTSSSSSDSTRHTRSRSRSRRCRKRRRYSSSSSSGSSSSSRPMWPKNKGARSRTPSSFSTSSSSSDDSSNYKRRRRRSSTRHRTVWSTRRHLGSTRHMQADSRSDHFYEPHPVESDYERRTFNCECGEKYGSQKALAHHLLQKHESELPCFGCSQKLKTLPKMLEHFETAHKNNLIACVYCKSVFGKPSNMTENQWKRLKTHMYGELVYAKLAELQGG